MKPTGRAKKDLAGDKSYSAKIAAVSCLCGSGAAGVLLSLFGLLFSLQDVPLGICKPMAVAAILLGCFGAGFLCARKLGQHGMVWGGVCGGILFFCLLLAQAMAPGARFGPAALSKCVMMLTSGMLGGIFGVNSRRR